MVRKDVHYSGSEKGSHLAQAHGSGKHVGGWGLSCGAWMAVLWAKVAPPTSDRFPWADLLRVTSVPL